MKLPCVALLALAAALGLAENADMAPPGPPGQTPDTPPETYPSPAEPVRVAAGRTFSIRLASNPTTGYGWQLAGPPDPHVVRCLTNTFEPPDSRLCGAGGHERWTFQALKAGQTTITLHYVRPWEKHTPPHDVKGFQVHVRE